MRQFIDSGLWRCAAKLKGLAYLMEGHQLDGKPVDYADYTAGIADILNDVSRDIERLSEMVAAVAKYPDLKVDYARLRFDEIGQVERLINEHKEQERLKGQNKDPLQ